MPTQCDIMNKVEINRIQSLIEQWQQDGEKVFYEIIVDGLKVVKKTDNPERFSNYQGFVTPDSKFIRIVLFHGGSNNSDAYEFWLKAKNPDEALEYSLGAVNTSEPKSYTEKEREELIKSRKTKDALAADYERIKNELADLSAAREQREKYITQLEEGIEKAKAHTEENQKLKKELADLTELREKRETYISQMEEAIEKFKANGNKQNIQIGEILSLGLEAFLKRNADLFKDIPVLNGLAGLGDTEKPKEEPQGEATFRKKGDPAPEQGVILTEQQKEFLRFFSDLQKLFSPQEMVQIFQILEALSRDKSKIQTVLELVR